MKSGRSEIRRQLRKWLKGVRRIAILGIGNPLRGDDGIGPAIVRKLAKSELPSWVSLYNCEVVPENFVDKVRKFKPTHILMIDSAYLNLRPGEARLVPTSRIKSLVISTHALPLTYLAKYLKKFTRAKIGLLAIQPKSVDFGLGLSPELEKTGESLTKILVEALKGENLNS